MTSILRKLGIPLPMTTDLLNEQMLTQKISEAESPVVNVESSVNVTEIKPQPSSTTASEGHRHKDYVRTHRTSQPNRLGYLDHETTLHQDYVNKYRRR